MFGLVSYFILFTVYLLVVVVYSNYDRKKKKKSSGPDCIPVVVLKNCGPELSYV